jgi:benzoyl-CoA reductase/2-hydroxyglutaryl-CoA dehydratase subunit BcrC/BadD/HgdB
VIPRRIVHAVLSHAALPWLAFLDRWRTVVGPRRHGGAAPFGPPLESTRKLKELLSAHYLVGRVADGAVPVAWVTSGFPVEILRPLGFHTVYPENHAAICSVKRMVPALSDAAERQGYSRDLCGYARTDLGALATGTTPVGRLPRPDLLCCCTNICQTVLYWFRELSARWRVPLAIVDTPFLYGEARPHDVDFVANQLRAVQEAAERVARRKVDRAAFSESVRMAREAARLWDACLRTGRAHPSPWTGFDTFFHLAPIVAMRGTEECNRYYRLLLDELRDRVARGVGGIADERVRLLWDNLPVWFALRSLATLLAENGFNVVCATYTSAWAEAGLRIDPADPERSSAHAYLNVLLNRDLRYRLSLMKRLCSDFGAAGAILHSDRSCKPYSIGQFDLKERLSAEAGVRTMLLEADHADPRAWSAEQARTRLHAFIECFP